MSLFKEDLIKSLSYYEKQVEIYKAHLKEAPKGKLAVQKDRNNRDQFLHIYTDGNERIRNGINSDEELIRALAKKEFAHKALKILEPDIRALKKLISSLTPFDPDAILKSMNKAYACLPEEYFFDRRVLASSLSLDEPLRRKIERSRAWGDSNYEECEFHSDNKTQISSRGKHMRSKSELLIIEKLYEYEIPHHYDEIVRIDGKIVVPDFIFRDVMDEPFYWEHLGMMDDPEYARRNMKKLSDCYRAGIIPGVNLILSFDRHGDIDMRMIETIIATEVLARL
jgi:hypothetical protein